jgi:imidazolonepropionase-like amidohydrolase
MKTRRQPFFWSCSIAPALFIALGCQRAAVEPPRAPGTAGDASPNAVAITNVTVIDVGSGAARTGRTVLVQGSRITAEASTAALVLPRNALVIDGSGRYVIPGLWDMHVHLDLPRGDEVLALYVANGVTGVRDMAGDWQRLHAWRTEIANGTRIGPRMIASGPYLEGGAVPIPHLLVRDTADAQPAVDSLIRLGVDFIKVHAQLDRARYFAIARAARARGVPFAGHVPRSVSAIEASDSGQRSIEHLLTIPNACTAAEAAALTPRFSAQGALGLCTTDDLAPMFATFVRNRTAVVPTLVAAYDIATWPNRVLPGDSFARYLPAEFAEFVHNIFPMSTDVPPGADSVGRALFAKRVATVGALHRAGVRVMAGTDAPLRNSPPGFGLHEELAWFVRAGLTPADALRAATLEPARFLGLADSLGTIEAGKLADLVLLDADPLADIANTRRIAAVMINGRLFDVRRTHTQVELRPRNQPAARWPQNPLFHRE